MLARPDRQSLPVIYAVLPVYGPGEAVFDQSFALPDFEKVN